MLIGTRLRSMRINKYMKAAIDEAYKGINKHEGGPFGSVVVKDGKIVGRGHNRVLLLNDCTCHGEMMAIRDACKKLGTFDLSGCDLYTTSSPCPMCEGAIQWSNIEHVYSGCTIEDAEDIGFRDKVFHEDGKEEIRLDRDACLKLFEDYKKTNPQNY